MNLLTNTLRVWAMHREFRAVLAELNGHSDRKLAELGLARGDTPAPVWQDPALVPGR